MTTQKLSGRDLLSLGIVGFCVLLTLVLTPYWMIRDAELYYVEADLSAAVAYTTALETIHVLLWVPLAGLLAWGIARQRPWRHWLQLVVAMGLGYGTILYFVVARTSGYEMMSWRAPSTFDLFLWVNLPWLAAAIWLGAEAMITLHRRAEGSHSYIVRESRVRPPLERFMRREVVTAHPDEPVFTVAARMETTHVGAVVVVDEQRKPIGMITDRDLALKLGAEGYDGATHVWDLMSDQVVTASVDDSIDDVISKMEHQGVRRIPLVDHEGAVAGLVSLDDLHVLLAGEAARAAEAIRHDRGP